MEKKSFDFDAFKKSAQARLKKGDSLLGKEGVLTPLLKESLEEGLDGELEAHLEEEVISYIHHNPVHYGFTDEAGNWPWSSYNIILGNTETWIEKDEVIRWFGKPV
jgi:hypothetical protein